MIVRLQCSSMSVLSYIPTQGVGFRVQGLKGRLNQMPSILDARHLDKTSLRRTSRAVFFISRVHTSCGVKRSLNGFLESSVAASKE